MIKIDRYAIEAIKVALQDGIKTSKMTDGLQIAVPDASDAALERAAISALQSLTIDVFDVHEVVVPSDVLHITGAIIPNFEEVPGDQCQC